MVMQELDASQYLAEVHFNRRVIRQQPVFDVVKQLASGAVVHYEVEVAVRLECRMAVYGEGIFRQLQQDLSLAQNLLEALILRYVLFGDLLQSEQAAASAVANQIYCAGASLPQTLQQLEIAQTDGTSLAFRFSVQHSQSLVVADRLQRLLLLKQPIIQYFVALAARQTVRLESHGSMCFVQLIVGTHNRIELPHFSSAGQ